MYPDYDAQPPPEKKKERPIMSIRGLGQPGQRTTTVQGERSEITITVKQAAIASLVLAVTFFVFYRAVMIPVSERIAQALPFARNFVGNFAQDLGYTLMIFGVLVPWFALGLSFVIQVFDINWPPPRMALSGDDGPAAPGWLRALIGWRDKGEEYTQMEIRTIPDRTNHVIEGDLLLGSTERGATKHNPRPKMALDEWDRLAKVFLAGDSVSIRDLSKHGFSKGAEGSARRINHELTKWHGLTEKGSRGKPYPVEPFRKWVLARHYADGVKLPPSPTVTPTHT